MARLRTLYNLKIPMRGAVLLEYISTKLQQMKLIAPHCTSNINCPSIAALFQ